MQSLGVGVVTGALILVGFWLLDTLGVQRSLISVGVFGGLSAWVASSVLHRFV